MTTPNLPITQFRHIQKPQSFDADNGVRITLWKEEYGESSKQSTEHSRRVLEVTGQVKKDDRTYVTTFVFFPPKGTDQQVMNAFEGFDGFYSGAAFRGLHSIPGRDEAEANFGWMKVVWGRDRMSGESSGYFEFQGAADPSQRIRAEFSMISGMKDIALKM